MIKDLRNNDRVMVDDPGRANVLFERLAPVLPGLPKRYRKKWSPVGLNDGFEGGSTSFRDHGHTTSAFGHLRVMPRTGMGLMFYHPIEHRGDPVVAGRKYVLRTHVMYASQGGEAAS